MYVDLRTSGSRCIWFQEEEGVSISKHTRQALALLSCFSSRTSPARPPPHLSPSPPPCRYLTWDSNVFPQPIELQDDVASRGRQTVTIVDPHVKRDHG